MRGDERELDALALLVGGLRRRVAVLHADHLVRVGLDPDRLDQRRAHRLGRPRVRIRRRHVLHRQHALRAPRDHVERRVGRDLVEPRPHRAAALEPRQPAPRTQQRVLQRVLGVVHRARASGSSGRAARRGAASTSSLNAPSSPAAGALEELLLDGRAGDSHRGSSATSLQAGDAARRPAGDRISRFTDRCSVDNADREAADRPRRSTRRPPRRESNGAVAPERPVEHVDVLIVGAGLSGIGGACHLQSKCPDKTFAILEARDAIGGTWDLFRYPGIRSDSDMFTLGYRFRRGRRRRRSPTGPSIRSVHPRHRARARRRPAHPLRPPRRARRVVVARPRRWTVDAERTDTGETVPLHAATSCSPAPATTATTRATRPHFAGIERFGGQIVHPQHWPEDLDYAGKRVVVIGSGATAVTLVPAMAEQAAHVTMLQRSPSYVVSLPAQDPIADCLRRRLSAAARLPDRALEERAAWRRGFYQLSRRAPEAREAPDPQGRRAPAARRLRRRHALHAPLRPVGPAPVPRPRRRPVRGDLAAASASIVTDRIETFTENGLRLDVGRGARGRHHRHRDRAQPADARRHGARRRRQRRSTCPRPSATRA